jgi:hypothetical protein
MTICWHRICASKENEGGGREGEKLMVRGLVLWLLGVPVSLIALLWLLGFLN